jgi:hypothetical protein
LWSLNLVRRNDKRRGEQGMRKKGDIVHYSAEELRGKIARGEDRTDWRKADSVTGEKLEASIRAEEG